MKAHEIRQRSGRQQAHIPSIRDCVAGPPQPTWVWGRNAIEDAAEDLLKLPQPILLIGEAKLLQPLRKRLSQAWIEAGVELLLADFPEDGECCQANLDRVLKLAAEKGAKTLLGLGGGKCLDTVKWAGLKSGLPVATLPSSAATCACATAVVVEHDAEGAVLGLIDLAEAPRLCIADLEVLKSAPARLLHAGVGDTLAKWLEWQAVEAQPEAAEAAKEAFEILTKGPQEGEEVLRACLRLSSEASLASQAPAAAAHSFCSGISLLPRSKALLHGEWAALGLVFQAWLLKQEAPAALEPWGLASKLPFKLEADERRQVALRILRDDESIHAIDFPASLSPEWIEEGLLALEA